MTFPVRFYLVNLNKSAFFADLFKFTKEIPNDFFCLFAMISLLRRVILGFYQTKFRNCRNLRQIRHKKSSEKLLQKYIQLKTFQDVIVSPL